MSLRTEFDSEVLIDVCKATRQHASSDCIIKAAKVQCIEKYLGAQALESRPVTIMPLPSSSHVTLGLSFLIHKLGIIALHFIELESGLFEIMAK